MSKPAIAVMSEKMPTWLQFDRQPKDTMNSVALFD
jgi:hypothetical protein